MNITRKLAATALALTLALAPQAGVGAAGSEALETAASGTAAHMLKSVDRPQMGSVGGEWAVIALARSGYAVPDTYYQAYYDAVAAYVAASGGVLHEKKYTEYSRVILGLTASGHDPRDVAGHDLTAPLADFEKTVWQGLNGPIWALIALDGKNYPNPQRDRYISEILRRQLDDGGWSLTGGDRSGTKGEPSDPDVTAMALQALAKYQDRSDVKSATEKALSRLSKIQDDKGGYSSDLAGGASLESAAQALIALCELGIPADDPRFVKNGISLLDNILSYRNADGGFRHGSADANSQMSSEQAFCALVAALRAAKGQSSLYRMVDAANRPEQAARPSDGLPGKHDDVRKVPISATAPGFSDVAGRPDEPAIKALAARGVINGVGDGSFNPDGPVTRAQLAKMAALSLGLPEKSANPFIDVKSGQWQALPVATAYHYGIVNGVGGGNFNPDGHITRQDAAVMAMRSAKLLGIDAARSEAEARDTLSQFPDYRSVSPYATEALAFCYSSGVFDDSAAQVEPLRDATRGEIAEMLYKLLEQGKML